MVVFGFLLLCAGHLSGKIPLMRAFGRAVWAHWRAKMRGLEAKRLGKLGESVLSDGNDQAIGQCCAGKTSA